MSDDLMSKVRIEFPRALKLDETRNLLRYVTLNLPASVSYQLTQYVNLILTPNKEKAIEEPSTFVIGGRITRLDDRLASDSFQTVPCFLDESPKCSALQFQPIPGYDYREYAPNVRALWDATRRVIRDYFKEQEDSRKG